jgi:hypothetical protein
VSWWRGETDRADDGPGGNPPRRASPNQAAVGGTGGTGTLLPPGYDRDDPHLDRSPLLGPEPPGVAEAQSAAARDVADELGRLDPAVKQRTSEPPADETAVGVERDHDRPDPFRYDPRLPPAGEPDRTVADPVDSPDDVLDQPDPNVRNHPTVALDRGPVPGQPPSNRTWLHPGEPVPLHPGEPVPRPTGTPATDARLEKLENSPFWLSEQERAAAPPPPDGPSHLAVGRRRTSRPATRRTAPALVALIVLALLSTFFAWVSAEPFWIAVGHGDQGYATTARCVGSGVTQRCTGTFAAADGGFAVSRVTLLGVAGEHRAAGTIAPARMVSADSRQAYLGDTGALVHLRWILGFVLVLVCGYAIAGLTGARRLETARARRGAVLVSLAGPLILLAGFLLAAY